MTLSRTETLALLVLVRHGPITCANLGATLWNKKRVAGNCSCPHARPAGAVIKRLRERGYAERYRIDGDPRTLYRATWRGRRLMQIPATPTAAPETVTGREAKAGPTKDGEG